MAVPSVGPGYLEGHFTGLGSRFLFFLFSVTLFTGGAAEKLSACLLPYQELFLWFCPAVRCETLIAAGGSGAGRPGEGCAAEEPAGGRVRGPWVLKAFA